MKRHYKIAVLFLLMFSNYGIDIIGYTYTIVNETGKDIKVQLRHLTGNLNSNFFEIKSKQSHPFSFPFGHLKAGLCLKKIMIKIKKENGAWSKTRKATIADRVGQPKRSFRIICQNEEFLLISKSNSELIARGTKLLFN